MGKAKARSKNASADIRLIPQLPPQVSTPSPAVAVRDLDTVISAYRDAVEDLPREPSDTAPSRTLRALLARTHLAEVLATAGASIDKEALARILALDERLQSSAAVLDHVVGRKVLASWRETIRPPKDAWWWSLDERAAASHEEYELGWVLLGWLLVMVTFSLATEISKRFLNDGPDFLSVFSTLSQALLTLLAGSSFTRFGSKRLERLLSRKSIHRKHRPLWKLSLALLAFGAVLGFRLSLPAIARFYNQQGVNLSHRGDRYGAIDSLKRAIALDPSSAEAHYNLAGAYENILDSTQAIHEYEVARHQGSFPELENNLAHLYLRKQDYKGAIQLLNERSVDPQDPELAYAFRKNRGWARLGLGLTYHARQDLEYALTLKSPAPAAHCLLAQVFEALKDKAEKDKADAEKAKAQAAAQEQWNPCFSDYAVDTNGKPNDFVEPEWLETARERVFGDQGGKP